MCSLRREAQGSSTLQPAMCREGLLFCIGKTGKVPTGQDPAKLKLQVVKKKEPKGFPTPR